MAEYPKLICTLPVENAANQLNDWDTVRAAATAEKIANGVALTLPADMAELVEDLAAREAECCSFLEVKTTVTADAVRLEISSEVPDASQVIEMLAGKPS